MKDLILLILNITAFACALGAVASVLSYFFGWTIRFKGAEVPGDLKATAMFLIMGSIAGGIVYIAGKKSLKTNLNKQRSAKEKQLRTVIVRGR